MKKHLILLTFLLFALVCQAQTVFKTKAGARYHEQTCKYLKSSVKTTVAKAQAEGLTACSVCRPAAGVANNLETEYTSLITTDSTSAVKRTSSSIPYTLSVQCSGTTKAGARCKRRTTSANGRCYQYYGNGFGSSIAESQG